MSETETVTCPKCSKICKDKRGLHVHEARCTGNNTICCDGCQTEFQFNAQLKRHQVGCDRYKEVVIRQEFLKREEELQLEMKIREEEFKTRLELKELYYTEKLEEKEFEIELLRDKINNREELFKQHLHIFLAEKDKEIKRILSEKKEIEENHKQNNPSLYAEENKLIDSVVHKIKLACMSDDKLYPSSQIPANVVWEYVYIIQEREFIKEKRPLYKIGRTKQSPNDRFINYPKGSKVIMFIHVNDCEMVERMIKKIFKQKFKQDTEIGVEYFEGNVNDMIKEFLLLKDNILSI